MTDEATTERAETDRTVGETLKRAWEWIAAAALIVILVTGEVAISRANRAGWLTYTAADGLAGDSVTSIADVPAGVVRRRPLDEQYRVTELPVTPEAQERHQADGCGWERAQPAHVLWQDGKPVRTITLGYTA